MMKRRLITLILALCLVAGLVPAASAAMLDNGLVYEVYEDHVEITGYNRNSTEVVIPSTIRKLPVTTIGDWAFVDQFLINSITIPASVTTIGEYAFYNCNELKNIVIPASVTMIGDFAFADCETLSKILVDAGNPNYSSDSCGVLFNKKKTELIQAPGAINGSYSIPDSVISIGNEAFGNCDFLTSIVIPNSVTSIGHAAFTDCDTLRSVSIPNSVNSIGDWIFFSCDSLSNITIPDNIISIGDCSFFDCTNLASITIPNSVTSIGDEAFGHCTNLSKITIPASVISIGARAFGQCSSLTTIYFKGNAPDFSVDRFGIHAFYDVTATAYYPANNSTWSEKTMQSCGGTITWVPYIPAPFTDVPEGSFYYDPVLWAVENGITTGATATTFNPNGSCLRAHVVTFLHRAAENPEPSSHKNPFTDVKSSDFFYKPVLWAVENGITNGVSATAFGSFSVCNRAAVVTFLWRAAGCPEPESSENPFKDVQAKDFFCKPVLWAVENGITNGLSATEFGPTADCNRAQVVTFLYRACN